MVWKLPGLASLKSITWRTFWIFLLFLLFRGRGKGGGVRGEKGAYFFLEIDGGGAQFFFRGRNVHQDNVQMAAAVLGDRLPEGGNSLASAQAAVPCSAGIERAGKCLQG